MLNFFSSNEILLQTIAVFSLLAFSVQISLRAGAFSLAGVGCWAIGGYSLAISDRHDMHPVIGVLIGIVVSAIISYLLALLLVRLRGLYLGMATIAFNQMVGIALIHGGDFTGGELGIYGIGARISTFQLFAVLALVSFLLWALERGMLGRAYNIVRDDEPLAASLGIDSESMRRFAFVLSGAVGGLAGALNAMMLGIVSPTDADFPVIVIALTMVIVGGYHSWLGALIGAALIQWLPIGLQSFGIEGMSEWWSVVYGLLILFIAVYMPRGLLGGLQRLGSLMARRHQDFREA